jgi:hypothetical protein
MAAQTPKPNSPKPELKADNHSNRGSPAQGASAGGVVDRRMWADRRATRVAGDPPPSSGLERRRGAGRRLSDFTRSAEEGELTKEQFLFLMAVEAFKKGNQKQFPSWTDVLEVVRLLGYRKTMPMELTLKNAEDWREPANNSSNVRPDRWHERAA